MSVYNTAMSVCLYVIMNLFMCMRCVHGTATVCLCPSVCVCLPPLSIRARRQKLFSGELVQFSMKMRFAGPACANVTLLSVFLRVYVSMSVCVHANVCGYVCVCGL